MSLPRYSSYKDSGVEWLGEVPSHWDVAALKHMANIATGYAFNSDHFVEDGVPVIRIGDISLSGAVDIASAKCIVANDLPLYEKYLVQKSDILMAMTGATIGKAGWFDGEQSALLNQRVCYFRAKKDVSQRYIWYILATHFYCEYLRLTAFGGAQPNISDGQLVGCIVCVPTPDEQSVIADFLDRETGKIDALVAEQERLIALLAEKRQAVISHAVTKGLNPTAPMKPSGIDWLGDIPAHWETRKLSTLITKITNGYVGPTRDILVESGVRYLQSLHIKNNSIRFEQPFYVSPEWSTQHEKSVLKTGDVLIVQTGDIGQVAVVPKDFEGCNCHALIVVTPKKNILTGDYLATLLNSNYGFHSLLSIQTGALHPHLNCGNVRDLYIPLPPMDEQSKVIDSIRDMMANYDELISAATRTVTLLQERRTALISAAVTGKIDVRGAKSHSEAA